MLEVAAEAVKLEGGPTGGLEHTGRVFGPDVETAGGFEADAGQ